MTNSIYVHTVVFLIVSNNQQLFKQCTESKIIEREGTRVADSLEEAVVKAFASSFFGFPLSCLSAVSSASCLSVYFHIESKSINIKGAVAGKSLQHD